MRDVVVGGVKVLIEFCKVLLAEDTYEKKKNNQLTFTIIMVTKIKVTPLPLIIINFCY